MKRVYLLISFLLMFWIVSCPLQAKTILLLGDSLSSGYGIPYNKQWAALLQDKIKNYKIVNISEPGLTTSGGLERLPRALELYQPSLTIIALGANDGLRGMPISGVYNRLSQLISVAQSYGQVLLIGVRLPPNYGSEYTKKFKEMYPRLAKEHRLTFPPFLLKSIADNPLLMQSDNLHPNSQAQPIMMKTVWNSLKLLLKNAS